MHALGHGNRTGSTDADLAVGRITEWLLTWEGTETDPAQWYWFEGNFAGYEQNKIARLGPDAARPHAVTHRRLTRD